MSQRTTPLMLVLATSALGFCGCSSTTNDFERADTDKDGALSKPELGTVFLEAIFAAADTNGDSKITWEEWKAADPEAQQSKFRTCDADKDGVVTPSELKSWTDGMKSFDKLFEAIDSDGSGKVSKAEAKVFHEELMNAEGASDVEKLLKLSRQS